MVCSDCRMGGEHHRRSMDAFNEGRLDEYEDQKFRAKVAHEKCRNNGCFCQHWTESNLIREGTVRA